MLQSDSAIDATEKNSTTTEHIAQCDSIGLRWDAVQGTCSKVALPCDIKDEARFKQLLRDDWTGSYSGIGNLDSSNFSCDFDPYSQGIADLVAQVLVPRFARRENDSDGLRAELHTLNVCHHPNSLHWRSLSYIASRCLLLLCL